MFLVKNDYTPRRRTLKGKIVDSPKNFQMVQKFRSAEKTRNHYRLRLYDAY